MKLFNALLFIFFFCILQAHYINSQGFNVVGSPSVTFANTKVFLRYGNCTEDALCPPVGGGQNECQKQKCFQEGMITSEPDVNPLLYKKSPYNNRVWFGTMSGFGTNDGDLTGFVTVNSLIFFRDKEFYGVNNNPQALRFQSIDFLPPNDYNLEDCSESVGVAIVCPMFGSLVMAVPNGVVNPSCVKVVYDFSERVIMDCVVDVETESVWVFTGNPSFDNGDSFNVDYVNPHSTPRGFIYRINLSKQVLDENTEQKGTLQSFNPFTNQQSMNNEDGAEIDGWYPISATKDMARGLIYAGGLDGAIIRIDPSKNKVEKVMDFIPGMHITKLVYHESTDSIFVGTNMGIMIEVSVDDFIMKNVFYLEGFPSVTHINVALHNDETLLIMASKDPNDNELKLWRANYVINPVTSTPELKVWEGLSSGFIVDQSSLGHDKSVISISSYFYKEGSVTLIPRHDDLEYTIQYSIIELFNCNGMDCNECVSKDPLFCRNCFVSSFIPTISCSKFNSPSCRIVESCPLAIYAEPSMFPEDSISSISIRGVNIFPYTYNNFRCKFSNDVTTTVTKLSQNEGRCALPSISLGEEDEITLSVKIEQSSGAFWTNEVDFTVYDCSAGSCETCSSKPGCGWCNTQAKCTSLKQCDFNTDVWSLKCPSISSVQPTSAPYDKEIELQITMRDFIYIEDLSYRCIFKVEGSDFVTTATYNSVDRLLICNTPNSLSENDIDSTLRIGVHMSGSNLDYSPSTPFEFYDCNQFTVCSLCVDDDKLCGWCSNTQECVNYDDSSECFFDESQCSLVLVATPSAMHIDEIQDISLTVSGDFSAPTYYCVLKNDLHTIDDIDAEVNGNKITCKLSNVDPLSLSIGNYKLYVADSLKNQYSGDINYSIYDCSSTTCTECVGNSKSSCRWRHKEMTCEYNLGTIPGAIYSGENCPSLLEVTPSTFNSKRSTLVTLKGNFGNYNVFDDQSEFSCRFGSSVRRDSFKFINSNTATCTSPSSMRPGESSLSIYYGQKQYTTSLQVEAYSCELINTTNCLNFSCFLCASPKYECTNVCNPAHTITTPPTITQVIPNSLDKDTKEIIQIIGGPFVLEGENIYTCKFYNDDTYFGSPFATRLDESTLTCMTPSNMTGDYVTLDIKFSTGGVEYDYLSTTLELYECNADAECSNDVMCVESCISEQPHCGWCYKTNKLSSKASCGADYWAKQCPKLDGPNYLYSPTSGGEEVKITLNVPLYAMVTEFNNAKGLASRALSPILCHFSDLIAEAIPEVSGGKTILKCVAPPYSAQTTMAFAVTWNDKVILEDVFEYANCIAERSCTECPGGTSVCGTCYQLNQCGYPGSCIGSSFNFDTTCPALIGIRPDSGSQKGGTEVIITGSPFFENMVDLKVYFGEKLATNVKYINESAISVVTPKNKPDQKGTEVRILVNGKSYFGASRSFTYTKEVSPVPIVLGVLFGLVLPISIAIAVLAFMKKKKLGIFKVYLKEPDYLEVIFGKHLKPLYKMPKDKYAKLEEALLDEDPSLVLSISAAVQPTDHDKLSRAFAELFYSHNRLKDYMIIFINDEVQRQLEENTVFRGNTIASKLFQLFAKIVGTRFLWNKIARLMKELDTLGEERLRKEERRGLIEEEVELDQTDYLSNVQSKKKGGQSVFKVEMEVDPTRIIEDAIEEDAMDAQANAYQLILTCQKIWGTLVKSLKEIPDELREVFIVCKDSIKAKFNSDDAVYKTIGGFLFLRFICPAFTIPHSYGLLERPPNQISQRQFVLIGKVLQNLANMVMPGIKEPYMAQLDEFFRKNIPRMQEFYIEILKPNYNPEASEKYARPVKPEEVPRSVIDNALSEIWSVVRGNKLIREYINETYSDDSKQRKKLNRILDDLTATYEQPKLKKEPKKPAPRGASRKKL